MREKYCWLTGGWCRFGVREKYCWQAKRIERVSTRRWSFIGLEQIQRWPLIRIHTAWVRFAHILESFTYVLLQKIQITYAPSKIFYKAQPTSLATAPTFLWQMGSIYQFLTFFFPPSNSYVFPLFFSWAIAHHLKVLYFGQMHEYIVVPTCTGWDSSALVLPHWRVGSDPHISDPTARKGTLICFLKADKEWS